MGTMTQRFPICVPETGRWNPWWKNFLHSLGDFNLGSSDFVIARDQALAAVSARWVIDWCDDNKSFERYVEFDDANQGLMFILKWS